MSTKFDYVVVGAGSSGCIVAARLTEDPSVRVLLVEAGGSDRSLFITMPGGLPFVYQNKRIGWGYRSGPEPYLHGKLIDEKAGRIIGSSSSINVMIFNRGNPMDYDGWAADGLKDWDYAHCLPYFRKMETFEDGPDEWRGGDGPLRISRARAAHQLYDAFLRGGEQAGLREVGVDVVADIPGVGRNLQNHPGVDIQFGTRYEDSLTAQLTLLGRARLGAEWLLLRKGLGTTNFFETGAFLPTRDDVGFPNMQYEFLPLTRQLKNGKLVPVPGFQFWMDLSRPDSRGYVKLRSKDPADAPLTVFRHYESRQDLKDMIDGIRLVRERLVRQPAWRKFRPQELSPGPDTKTDSDLDAFVRKATGTSYHPSGTCRTGVDPDAVVDGEGRVNAVPGLRIADASIMPRIVTGNLNAPVMMTAEKIADRIRGRQPLPPSNAVYYRTGPATG